MKRLIFAALLLSSTSLSTVAFANANAGSKLFICTTPQQSDLDRSAFELLAWVEIKSLGSHGEIGASTNILTYDTWDSVVVQKAKGMTNAGDPDIELARLPTDPGQNALRAASLSNMNYAFKILRNDPAKIGGEPTTIYYRALVTGPKKPLGRNEDFDLEVFTFGLNQLPLTVDPTSAGIAPVNTVVPTITGTAKVGTLLTSSTGTFTGDAPLTYEYQWFAGGVPVAGANASTFTPLAAQLGKIITVRVIATNVAGMASSVSEATAAVVA